MELYETDAAIGEHVRRSDPFREPLIAAFTAMTMDERWVIRSPDVMLATFPWFRGEGFQQILADVLALAADRPVLVEGFRLLPRLVAQQLTRPRRAAWLIPTPALRLAAFEARGTLPQIAGRTSGPQRALRNLLERDALFTDEIAAEARTLGLPVIEVDGGRGVDDTVHRVAVSLGLQAPPMPLSPLLLPLADRRLPSAAQLQPSPYDGSRIAKRRVE
ncbi:MAG TPA: hypothetical protein VF153_08250 [Candidatus Limnocylindria bacterium]